MIFETMTNVTLVVSINVFFFFVLGTLAREFGLSASRGKLMTDLGGGNGVVTCRLKVNTAPFFPRTAAMKMTANGPAWRSFSGTVALNFDDIESIEVMRFGLVVQLSLVKNGETFKCLTEYVFDIIGLFCVSRSIKADELLSINFAPISRRTVRFPRQVATEGSNHVTEDPRHLQSPGPSVS